MRWALWLPHPLSPRPGHAEGGVANAELRTSVGAPLEVWMWWAEEVEVEVERGALRIACANMVMRARCRARGSAGDSARTDSSGADLEEIARECLSSLRGLLCGAAPSRLRQVKCPGRTPAARPLVDRSSGEQVVRRQGGDGHLHRFGLLSEHSWRSRPSSWRLQPSPSGAGHTWTSWARCRHKLVDVDQVGRLSPESRDVKPRRASTSELPEALSEGRSDALRDMRAQVLELQGHGCHAHTFQRRRLFGVPGR